MIVSQRLPCLPRTSLRTSLRISLRTSLRTIVHTRTHPHTHGTHPHTHTHTPHTHTNQLFMGRHRPQIMGRRRTSLPTLPSLPPTLSPTNLQAVKPQQSKTEQTWPVVPESGATCDAVSRWCREIHRFVLQTFTSSQALRSSGAAKLAGRWIKEETGPRSKAAENERLHRFRWYPAETLTELMHSPHWLDALTYEMKARVVESVQSRRLVNELGTARARHACSQLRMTHFHFVLSILVPHVIVARMPFFV